MPSDQALLQAWGAGDKGAARELLERNLDPLARFFRSKVSGSIDDFVQETLARCLSRREALRPDSSFRAYMFCVARNLLYEHYRKQPRALVLDPEQVSVADLAPTPSAVVGRSREQRLMMRALQQLPLAAQLSLELFYWEELSLAEMAEVLCVPTGTVKSRLHRARRQLRERLQAIGRGDPMLASTLQTVDAWDDPAP